MKNTATLKKGKTVIYLNSYEHRSITLREINRQSYNKQLKPLEAL